MDSFAAKTTVYKSQILLIILFEERFLEDLLKRCIGQPMDNGDQTFEHSCYRLNSERREEDGKANMYHKI